MPIDRPQFTEAEEIFMKASGKCPASVTAQSAYIASVYKKKNVQPIQYKDLLKNDQNALERIMLAANKAHIHIPNEEKPLIEDFHVKRIFSHDFNFAEKITSLDYPQLENIYCTLYENLRSKEMDIYVVEQELYAIAINMLDKVVIPTL